ncbi:MAG: glycosyltransferase [Patescibacteria group bacterium]|nr:glycosyltransferase [Patescibacteria group bacterium]
MTDQRIEKTQKPKLLLIAIVSEEFHLGAILLRAARDMKMKIDTFDMCEKVISPSLKTLPGRLFRKISGHLFFEWWEINRKIIKKIHIFKPDLILVTGIFPLNAAVFKAAHANNSKIVNYLTDCPFNFSHYSPMFVQNLKLYDFIFSTKSIITKELKRSGAKKVIFLPFAYDPYYHFKSEKQEQFINDVCFIGTATVERLNFFNEFLKYFKGRLILYGNGWSQYPRFKKYAKGAVVGKDYCSAISKSKIILDVVSLRNKDQSNMRSYEIPACGGAGLYSDSLEHRQLFKNYPDNGFFKSPLDLALKCNRLLQSPTKLESLRSLGEKNVVNHQNTYRQRLEFIIQKTLYKKSI